MKGEGAKGAFFENWQVKADMDRQTGTDMASRQTKHFLNISTCELILCNRNRRWL